MIQISQLKLAIPHQESDIREKICKTLRIREDELKSFRICKRSLDARKKPSLFYVYTVEVDAQCKDKHLQQVLKRNSNVITKKKKEAFKISIAGDKTLEVPPVIVGTGPAGLFCGYELALKGYKPILIERGGAVEERMTDVEKFWEEGILDPNSNVQFGEGGAGTFSDGKLNTLVNDKLGLGSHVMDIFVKHGAPDEIRYDHKPHIGTDLLVDVVKSMRETIIAHGGTVLFHTQVTDIETKEENGSRRITSLTVEQTQTKEVSKLPVECAIFAIGHSARDTFAMLHDHQIPMEAKSFAVGVRMEHPQAMINESQYGVDDASLPAANYKLTANLPNGRGVYTFCMCPGGYVVNASSEEGMLAVNGMSYSRRDGKNANSAVIVTISPEDYHADGPLSGVEFQRSLERKAYEIGKGKIPVQTFGDFKNNIPSTKPGDVLPQMKGQYTWANVREIFPEELASSLVDGILSFDKKLKGYAREDALVSGVESRTSSPVRIMRNETLQSEVQGFFPCGEGAGYAGGITSAAMDGIKVASTICQMYQPFDKAADV